MSDQSVQPKGLSTSSFTMLFSYTYADLLLLAVVALVGIAADVDIASSSPKALVTVSLATHKANGAFIGTKDKLAGTPVAIASIAIALAGGEERAFAAPLRTALHPLGGRGAR